MSPSDRYLIGVTGDVTTPTIPEFSMVDPCEGIDTSNITYSSRYVNQPEPWENEVWFYPDTRQYRFNINDFQREGFLDQEMVAGIDYYVVPTECPMEEQILERRIKKKDLDKYLAAREAMLAGGGRRRMRDFKRDERRELSFKSEVTDPCEMQDCSGSKSKCKTSSDYRHKKRKYR